MMKVIMNPPYNRSLHLKILSRALEYSDDIVNLSPIRWLQDPLAEYKKNSDWFHFANIRKHIESVDVVSLEEMSHLFSGIDIAAGIYHLTEDGGFDINKIRCTFLNNFIKKEYTHMKDVLEQDQLDGWRVRCGGGVMFKGSTRLSSNSVKLSMDNYVHFTLDRIYYNGYIKGTKTFWSYDRLPGAGNKIKPEGTPIPSSIRFDTEEEAKNFVSSTRTKFYKYINRMSAMYGGSKDDILPFLPTYKHPWTDQMLYEYFGLTEDEIEEIEKK